MAKNAQTKGCDKAASARYGSGFSAFEEASMLRAIGALRQLARHVVVKDADIRYPMYAMIVLSQNDTHPIAKIAAAAILDICYPEWREKARPEILGPVAQRRDNAVGIWRREVLKRDNRTCQNCGSGEKPEAHHILRWVDFPEARLLVSNGITYCETCHKTVPKGGLCAPIAQTERN